MANVCFDLNKYVVVKHRTTGEFYATLSQDWNAASEQKVHHFTTQIMEMEVICYRLTKDVPSNSYRLTDNKIKIKLSELVGVPVAHIND